jgi:predicted ATPase
VDGIAKPTAARVMALANGGQLLLTTEAVESLGKTMLRVRSHGHWLMKGLAEPVELFEVNAHDAAFAVPAGADKARRVVQSGGRWVAVDELPNNLPQLATNFIGRERELAEVKALLDKTRLLTLLGMGGLGKTRLSLQVAAEVRHRFPDGVWFIDLAPLRDPTLVAGEVAQVLDIRDEPGRPLLQTVCAALRSRTLLLILDNCEHLLAAAGELANAVLRGAPNLRVLASSREALHVPGEQIVPILPLQLPRPGDAVDALADATAVRLFIDRARLQKPDFAFTPQEAPAIAELVTRLEGIPLALELAAARVRMLSVAEINARLKDRYKLLTGGGRVLLERQQTLRALVDWSYDLLDDRERRLLARLAAFAGGFELEAVEQVAGAEPLDPLDVMDLLGSLVEKSLVMPDERDGRTRYRMLETIRDYAREKLVASGELDAIAARHCEHFFALAKQMRDGLRGAAQAEWLQRGEADHDNLRAAMTHARSGAVDPFIAVKMAVAMQGFWMLRGYIAEGRAYVRSALAMPAIEQSDLARSWALYVGAALATGQSDHAEARQMLEVCLQLRRGLGNPVDIAATLSTLSLARLQAGNVAAARTDEQEALAIFERLDDRFGQAICLLHLAQIDLFSGDDAAARDFAERCLALARSLGHKEIEAECELVLGELAAEAGDGAGALDRIRRSLSVCTEAGDRRGEAIARWWLGRILLSQAYDSTHAAEELLSALPVLRDAGMREELLGALEDVSRLALATGRCEIAVQLAAMVNASRERLSLARSTRHQTRWRHHLEAVVPVLDGNAYASANDVGAAWDARDAVAAADCLRH